VWGEFDMMTVLPATSLERASRIFVDTLWLRIEIKDSERRSLILRSGECSRLMTYERGEASRAEHTVAGFDVKDVAAELDSLKTKGVGPEQYDMPGLKTDERGTVAMGDTTSAWIKDTERNIIAIMQGMLSPAVYGARRPLEAERPMRGEP
jgi:hypothetical protein